MVQHQPVNTMKRENNSNNISIQANGTNEKVLGLNFWEYTLYKL